MIPKETVDRILDAARIEDVIGDFVTLKRQGANYLACCPFHDEKTPSFTVSPAKGFYYCFGCKKGGSSVTFLMDHENMSYSEALRYLARKYNIEVTEEEETPETIAARQRSESLLLVSEFAAGFFRDNLKEGEGRALGYAYFRNRGVEQQTMEKFGLGWCPSDRYALLNAARQAGYKEDYLVESGLCIRTEEGKVYDRFHDRAIFPIHSVSGRVVAFGGRTLRSDKTVAKYVNSPETEIYVKNKSLYGIWFAKGQIAKLDKCILVEGYLDVISMHQLGITNVVASSGTSLTTGQIRLIKRFTENVTIIYDGDWAGIHAAVRGIGLILSEGMNVKVVLLPEGQDPDDFARSHTLEEVGSFIERNEQDFIAFKTDMLLNEAGDDPLKRAGLINDIADTIALIPDPVKRMTYTDSCAAKFSMEREILKNRVERTRNDMAEEEYRQRTREAERARAVAPPQVVARAEAGKPTVKADPLVNDPVLAPVEEEMLDYLLNHGTDRMLFSDDSRYFCDPPMTVAEFIDSSLSADNTVFSNVVHRAVYDEYFRLYDEGLQQDAIIHSLVSGQNPDMVNLVVRLTVRRHELTKKNLVDSLTKTSTVLIQKVPASIVLYQIRRLDKQLEQYRDLLMEGNADEEAILTEISHLNVMRSQLNNALGRI